MPNAQISIIFIVVIIVVIVVILVAVVIYIIAYNSSFSYARYEAKLHQKCAFD